MLDDVHVSRGKAVIWPAFLVMRCCVCLFQQSLRCSSSKMAAGESNSRSSCLNLSNSGPLGNAPPSNSAHSSPASNGGAVAAAGGMNRSAGNANPRSGPENGGGAESAVRSTPSAHNAPRQSICPSGATSGAASNMTATQSSSSSSSSSTASSSADASAAIASLPCSPASVLVYREPVYNWQATKSTVKERFAFLFNNEVLSDVHFLVGKGMGVQRIPAHR